MKDHSPSPVTPTRAAGLARLEEFAPRMGRRYASGRNYDRGPGRHTAVSTLSPWVRRRLVTERDLLATAIGEHGPEGAEKFVSEVFWRGYFKGWLERRPQVWADYREGLSRDLWDIEDDRKLSRAVAEAEDGRTGIEAFDAWARELVETGYLHNHARMWFASIWCFTLELPWRIGADFFYRNLLDGDPASNTLSWRWVAGLHTRGRTYRAEAWNIRKYTSGRFDPAERDLAADAPSLDRLEPDGLPDTRPLRSVEPPQPGVPTLLVLTEEDCRWEDLPWQQVEIAGAVTLTASHLRSPRPVADHVSAFEAGALADSADRLGLDARRARAGDPADLARWAQAAGATQIATAYVPTGPLADWFDAALPGLQDAGLALTDWRRDYDAAIWPHCTAGFFKVKKKIPALLDDLGLS